jgi:hypothetical protein
MAFPIFSGRGWKSWSTVSNSCSLTQFGIQTLAAFYAKLVEKNTIGRSKSIQGPMRKSETLIVKDFC